jgi:hypothetical protein
MLIKNLFLYAVPETIFVAMLSSSLQVHSAQADGLSSAALAAISDTADRICGTVSTQGEAASSKVSTNLHAELGGLARRLASIGISGATDITSAKYQGVLQQDLAATLKDVRICKMRIFETLSVKILPGVTVPSGAAAPSGELLQSPSSAPLIDFIKDYYGPQEVGLYSCANAPSQTDTGDSSLKSGINCYGTFIKSGGGPSDFGVDWLFPGETRLVDNFHVEHRLRHEFFLNGLGEKKQNINLSAGEGVWWALEFEPGTRLPSSGRIILFNGQFQTPIN